MHIEAPVDGSKIPAEACAASATRNFLLFLSTTCCSIVKMQKVNFALFSRYFRDRNYADTNGNEH